jgi:hypothetical protein
MVVMTKPKIESPPLLEQLGALGSLLIHDVANQMCIISGNATFAQMILSDPQQVERAVNAITKSGEHLSFILTRCADLRRKLASELPHGEGDDVAEGLRDFFATRPEWRLEIHPLLTGELYVPTAWAVFAVGQILRELPEVSGEVDVRRVRPDEDTAFLPGGAYFEVRLSWTDGPRFSIDEVRKQYRNFGLLAAFELVRQCGGRLEGLTPGGDRREVRLAIPYLFEIGADT